MAVTGLQGQVVFSEGWVEKPDGWSVEIFQTAQDKTSFQPVGNHEVLVDTGLVRGGGGSYTCKLPVLQDNDSNIGDKPFEWTLFSECQPLMTTQLGHEWHTWEPGLISTRFEGTSWIDSNIALPIPENGTALLELNDTDNYSIPYVALDIITNVTVEGEAREMTIVGAASAEPTRNGNVPYPGITGSAEFIAQGSRIYTGNILVTGVMVYANRAQSIGQARVDFVFDGEITGE